MKKSFTESQVTSAYKSLAIEVFTFWDMDTDKIPPFRCAPYYEGPAISPWTESTEWSETPSSVLASTNYASWDLFNPTDVVFNSFYLPYMYEDELLVTLLHELAHVRAGWAAAHDDVWAAHANEVGSVGEPVFITRATYDGVLPWISPEIYVLIRQKYTAPTLGTI